MALDIATYLQEYLVTNSAATVSNIPNFIEIGIQKINKRLRGTFVETASTSPTLPSDFAAMRYLTVNGVQYNYKLQAEPGSFFVAANTLTITPALESGDLLNYVYYAINETDLTAVAPAMLIHAAAAEALMFEGNLDGAQTEYALAASLIDDGNGWDSQGTLTLGGLTTAGSVSGGTAPPPMLASNVQFTPSGTIAATNVQTAIQELDNETQAQFSQANADIALKADITYVDSRDALKADITYVDSRDALKANLDSPAFTGNPTAPTPLAGDNDTSVATTAFVVANRVSNPVGFTGNFVGSGIATEGLIGFTPVRNDGGFFSASRFTPLVAGYYVLTCSAGFTIPSMSYAGVKIMFNGVILSAQVQGPYLGNSASANISTVIYFNGTTDYAEFFYISSPGGGTLTSQTVCSGSLVQRT